MTRPGPARFALLGTTAFVGLLANADPALASEPIKLGVGGFFREAYVAVFDDDGEGDLGNERNTDGFFNDAEVHFKGETTLDNGLTVGAHIELKGETNSDQIDETWIYFSGGFGELKFGSTNDALVGICLLPPGGSRDQRRRRDRLYLARHRSGIAGWRGRLQRAGDRHRNRDHFLAPCAMDDLQWRTRL